MSLAGSVLHDACQRCLRRQRRPLGVRNPLGFRGGRAAVPLPETPNGRFSEKTQSDLKGPQMRSATALLLAHLRRRDALWPKRCLKSSPRAEFSARRRVVGAVNARLVDKVKRFKQLCGTLRRSRCDHASPHCAVLAPRPDQICEFQAI